jgi:hypothetical protein
MKQWLTIPVWKNNPRNFIITAVLLIVLLSPGWIFGQAGNTQKEAPATIEEAALIAPSLDLITIQRADNSISLKSALKAKYKGALIKLPYLKVTFIQVSEASENVLGFIITDRSGKGEFNYKSDSLKTDKEGKLHFKAMFAGNKSMEPAEAEVTIKRARLEIIPVKEDSLLTVKVKLIDIGSGAEVPVPETALGLFVTRYFNPLKVGEGTTDAAGEVTIEIPGNLTGDTIGNINLLVKLDENEIYGNVEASVIQPWGTKVSDKLNELPRALWSAHPPIWMVITFIVLMTTVWGHYIVIIYELFRLRKEEPHDFEKAASQQI